MSEPKYGWAKTVGMVTSIPFLLLVSIGIGLAFGMWLDGKLNTAPWLTLLFTLLGLASGIYEAAKLLIDATRNNGD